MPKTEARTPRRPQAGGQTSIAASKSRSTPSASRIAAAIRSEDHRWQPGTSPTSQLGGIRSARHSEHADPMNLNIVPERRNGSVPVGTTSLRRLRWAVNLKAEVTWRSRPQNRGSTLGYHIRRAHTPSGPKAAAGRITNIAARRYDVGMLRRACRPPYSTTHGMRVPMGASPSE